MDLFYNITKNDILYYNDRDSHNYIDKDAIL